MIKKALITILLALAAMAGLAQTKTATVTGYSPALKDGTLVFAGIGSTVPVVDTVQAGRFAYTLPVEEFTESTLSFYGEGCPNSHAVIFLRQHYSTVFLFIHLSLVSMGSRRPRTDAAFSRLKNNLLHPNVPKYRKKQRRLHRVCEKMIIFAPETFHINT